MDARPVRSRPSVNWRPILLAAVITLTVYLAANPTPRENARTFLQIRVIPALHRVDPGMIRDQIWWRTCPAGTPCTLLGQVIRLPGALVATAQYVAGTGWPGIAIAALTVIFMVPMFAGAIDNPLMWPFVVLFGIVIASVFLWGLKWMLIGMAAALAGILWGIAAVAGWLLAGDWVLRGFEIRRAIGGGPHGGTASAAKGIRPEGGHAGR